MLDQLWHDMKVAACSVSVLRSLFNLWHYIPANFAITAYHKVQRRYGWAMPIAETVGILEGKCRAQLQIWHHRLAEQHLRAHVQRGCISAIEGERFMQAL
ncbi:unnamed protein product, partial [Symbiodinium natans]